MLDADLAELYSVPTYRLDEAVKRNSTRFPEDFMFRLTAEEYISLISQIARSKPGRGGRRKLPYAFTEQGVAMLSSDCRMQPTDCIPHLSYRNTTTTSKFESVNLFPGRRKQ